MSDTITEIKDDKLIQIYPESLMFSSFISSISLNSLAIPLSCLPSTIDISKVDFLKVTEKEAMIKEEKLKLIFVCEAFSIENEVLKKILSLEDVKFDRFYKEPNTLKWVFVPKEECLSKFEEGFLKMKIKHKQYNKQILIEELKKELENREKSECDGLKAKDNGFTTPTTNKPLWKKYSQGGEFKLSTGKKSSDIGAETENKGKDISEIKNIIKESVLEATPNSENKNSSSSSSNKFHKQSFDYEIPVNNFMMGRFNPYYFYNQYNNYNFMYNNNSTYYTNSYVYYPNGDIYWQRERFNSDAVLPTQFKFEKPKEIEADKVKYSLEIKNKYSIKSVKEFLNKCNEKKVFKEQPKFINMPDFVVNETKKINFKELEKMDKVVINLDEINKKLGKKKMSINKNESKGTENKVYNKYDIDYGKFNE